MKLIDELRNQLGVKKIGGLQAMDLNCTNETATKIVKIENCYMYVPVHIYGYRRSNNDKSRCMYILYVLEAICTYSVYVSVYVNIYLRMHDK
jgi:hypothetical protein